MKFKLFWAWFDFWIGFYYDRRKSILYFCPIPTVVFAISLKNIDIPTAEYDGTLQKITVDEHKREDRVRKLSETGIIKTAHLLLEIKRKKIKERAELEDWFQCVILRAEINLLENLLHVD